MTRIIAAVLLGLLPLSASADDLGQQCAAAYEAGNTTETRRIIPQLTTGRHILSEAGILAGRYCIEAVLGVEHEFNRQKGHYEKVDVEARGREWEERRKAEDARQREQREEREQAERQREQAERQREEGERTAAVLERLQERAARIQAEREAAVYGRLQQACTTLYERRPDETITNKLCLDVFLATGLPGG